MSDEEEQHPNNSPKREEQQKLNPSEEGDKSEKGTDISSFAPDYLPVDDSSTPLSADLEETLNEIQIQNQQLTLQIQQLSDQIQHLSHSARIWRKKTLTVDDDGKTHVSLATDTFSLMMVSELGSIPWLIGLGSFALQIILLLFLCSEMFSGGSFLFEEVFEYPDATQACAQFLVLLAIFFLQPDLIEASRCLFILDDKDIWHLLEEDGSPSPPPSSTSKKILRFVVPNVLKLIMAIITIATSVVITLQADTILDLLKDFAALMIISEIDNGVFALFAENGYFGLKTLSKAKDITQREVIVDDEAIFGNWRHRKDVWLISFIYILAVCGWLVLVGKQINGVIRIQANRFRNEHPKCIFFDVEFYQVGDGNCDETFNSESCGWDAGDCIDRTICLEKLEERTAPPYIEYSADDLFEWLGDGACDGLNNIPECSYDDGDCDEFNVEYPNCKNVLRPYQLGDQKCDRENKRPECGNDGGDCPGCLSKDPDQLGVSLCDHMTERCDWPDGSDCEECVNQIKEIVKGGENWQYLTWQKYISLLGDGECDSVNNITECNYDGGDCLDYNNEYDLKKCHDHIKEMAKEQNDGNDFEERKSWLRNGVCDISNNVPECNYDGGDCNECNNRIKVIAEKNYYDFDFVRGSLGNGICESPINIPECNYDGGDCIEFNEKYPNCDSVYIFLMGDGRCDPPNNNPQCRYDDGDCPPPEQDLEN